MLTRVDKLIAVFYVAATVLLFVFFVVVAYEARGL